MAAWGKFHGWSSQHPLLDHMLDVAECLRAIVSLPRMSAALERVAGKGYRLTSSQISRLSALAFLHDIGKANAGFQVKRWAAVQELAPAGWPLAAGHVDEAWWLFEGHTDAERLLQQLPLTRMSEWGEATLSLLCASISHHGRPPQADRANPGHLRTIWQPVQSGGVTVYDE